MKCDDRRKRRVPFGFGEKAPKPITWYAFQGLPAFARTRLLWATRNLRGCLEFDQRRECCREATWHAHEAAKHEGDYS